MFEKCFQTTDQSTFKKEKTEGRTFWCDSDEKVCRMWLGRGNEVAHTPLVPKERQEKPYY